MANQPQASEAGASKPAGSAALVFTDVDKAKARRWFSQGKQVTESRNYDYGIECYITGLSFWPEAVEEGHMPLRLLSMQRMLAGGKKPGMTDSFKKPMSGKDAKQAMLNAEELLAKDPKKPEYMEGVVRNAAKAGYFQTVKWIAPTYYDALRTEKKPNAGKLKALREVLEEAGDRSDAQGDTALAVWFYEKAADVQGLVVKLLPNDGPAATDYRNLNGKLTIVRGKYSSAEDFRESLRDADKAKLLHDAERVVQADDAVENLIRAARKEYEASPTTPAKVTALVEHLLRRERKEDENEAIAVLERAAEATKTYNFKMKADDVRLKQLNREYRALLAKAKESGSAEDKQQARLAATELVETEIAVCRDRVKAYPTDLRIRYRLGLALFRAKRYDEAIPVFQEAQMEPKHRVQAMYHMGRCFFEKEIYEQAYEVLGDAAKAYEIEGDDFSKELTYWLGRAFESAGKKEEATSTYGRLLRQDYNYGDGEVRKRLEELKKG